MLYNDDRSYHIVREPGIKIREEKLIIFFWIFSVERKIYSKLQKLIKLIHKNRQKFANVSNSWNF